MINLFLSFLKELFLRHNIPIEYGLIVFSVVYFVVIVSFLMFTVIMLVLFERKLLGYFTQRKGPNRVGPFGLFQTMADGIKLLCKENIELDCSDKFLFTLSPIIIFTSVILLWCVVPYNSDFGIINSSISLLLFIFLSSIPMLFNFLAGYSSFNRYSVLGGYRGVLLSVSYSMPFMITILSIGTICDSLDLKRIIQIQSNGWGIFFNLIGFIIFYIAVLAKLNRCPFDLSEAESELVCGYHTEYSGMRFGMFFLAEYAELFIMSILISILFLGGYLPPFGIYLSNIILGNCSFLNYFIYFEQTLWLLFKALLVIFSIIWIRATLPRLSQNNVLNLFWKFLTPISIINLVIIIYLKMGQLI